MKPMTKYQKAVSFIALNDDPGSSDSMDLDAVKGYVTVTLVSETFGVPVERVAQHVLRIRGPFLDDYVGKVS